MRHRYYMHHAPALIVVFTLSSMAVAGPIFTGVGDLPGGTMTSQVVSVSPDGSWIVGSSDAGAGSAGLTVFRARIGSGAIQLETLGGSGNRPIGIANTGRTLGSGRASTLILWEPDGQETILPSSAGIESLQPFGGAALSGDGTVVATAAQNANGAPVAVAWSATSGYTELGRLPNAGGSISVSDISFDGSTIVGTETLSDGGLEAYRWTSESGIGGLGDLPGDPFASVGAAVSPDGGSVVGTGRVNGTVRSALWTVGAGIEDLGDHWQPTAVSDFARVIVGARNFDFPDSVPVVWDREQGTRDLADILLEDHGIDIGGWQLQNAFDISADGRVIVGTGINPLGQREGWVAVIPEPASILLLAVGSVLAARRRPGRPRGGSSSLRRRVPRSRPLRFCVIAALAGVALAQDLRADIVLPGSIRHEPTRADVALADLMDRGADSDDLAQWQQTVLVAIEATGVAVSEQGAIDALRRVLPAGDRADLATPVLHALCRFAEPAAFDEIFAYVRGVLADVKLQEWENERHNWSSRVAFGFFKHDVTTLLDRGARPDSAYDLCGQALGVSGALTFARNKRGELYHISCEVRPTESARRFCRTLLYRESEPIGSRQRALLDWMDQDLLRWHDWLPLRALSTEPFIAELRANTLRRIEQERAPSGPEFWLLADAGDPAFERSVRRMLRAHGREAVFESWVGGWLWMLRIQKDVDELVEFIRGDDYGFIDARAWAYRKAVDLGVDRQILREAIFDLRERARVHGAASYELKRLIPFAEAAGILDAGEIPIPQERSMWLETPVEKDKPKIPPSDNMAVPW